MANNLKSRIRVIANDDAIKSLDDRLEKCEYNDILSFAQSFYDDVDVSDDGVSVMNEWSLNKLGSKWTYLYDFMADDEFSIESAWYPPKEFLIHLYNLMSKIDPETIIEVQYEDETYNPIGSIVIKKDDDGVPVIYQDEDDEMEDPTEDMDWDDEGYDEAQMDFMDSIMVRQDEMLKFCYEMIEENEGEEINN